MSRNNSSQRCSSCTQMHKICVHEALTAPAQQNGSYPKHYCRCTRTLRQSSTALDGTTHTHRVMASTCKQAQQGAQRVGGCCSVNMLRLCRLNNSSQRCSSFTTTRDRAHSQSHLTDLLVQQNHRAQSRKKQERKCRALLSSSKHFIHPSVRPSMGKLRPKQCVVPRGHLRLEHVPRIVALWQTARCSAVLSSAAAAVPARWRGLPRARRHTTRAMKDLTMLRR